MKSIYYKLLFLNIPLLSMAQPQAPQKVERDDDKISKKPNVIFILTDDQRWSALGYAGNKNIQTPEMDKLAEEGVYFSNALVTTPICSASRASILTGLHERTHRYTFQTGDIRGEFMDKAYPYLLKDAGYYTGFYGKFGVNYSEKEKMFDVAEIYDRNNSYKDYRGYYYKKLGEETVHLTRYTGQKAMDFIDMAPTDKPFCLSLSFSAPHAHDGAPEQYFWQEEPGKLYNDQDMPEAEISDDKYFNRLPLPVREGFNRLRWGWRYDTPEKYQHSVKGYYRMIYGIDLEIAKIRKKLEETGQAENTVIILMGDNGQFLGERQIAGKWLMYDNSVRVPLIIYHPGINKHMDIEDMALNIDIPSTILDIAGVSIPDTYQGKSLLSVVSGGKNSMDRDTVLVEHLWEFENIPPSEGVRTNEWKYLRYINNKSYEELYNLKKDPKETKNLASKEKYKQVLEEFRRKNDELGQKFADPFSGTPVGLSIETIREPSKVRIVDPRPEFSWKVPSVAVLQKAYQILVSSSNDLINKNIGDMWDSGNTRSNESVRVEYKGKPLLPDTEYFWKVRIFDGENRISEYSEVQKFRTGSFDGDISTQNFFQIESIEPVRVKEIENGYFIDFGKAAFGTLRFNYQSQQTELLTIRVGEKLLDGRIDSIPGGTIRYQELQVQVTPDKDFYQIELVPDVRNTNELAIALPDSFPVIIPFRYAEVLGAGKDFNPSRVTQIAYFNYFDYNTSSFSSSDTILNQVWDLCKYSMKATTFAGYYVDGERERIPYEADAYLQQLSHYCTDNEYAIARKTIEYFFMSKPTWPTEWQLHVAMMIYQDYMFSGNTEIIEKYYEKLKAKTLMALEVEDGFISTESPNHNGELMLSLGFPDTTKRLRDIVDWPPESNNFGGIQKYQKGERDGFVFTRINTVVNAFYYHNMVIMAEFARLLDKPYESLDFELKAAKVKKSINEQLFNEEKGYYVDGIGTDHGSLHSNMVLIAFDVVPESRMESVTDHVKSRGMACSVYGAQYLMEALYKAGEADYAHELMSATHDRSWYNMIKIGSTITLEAWDMKYKVNGDWNHAWGAVPGNIIPRGMWGINPQTPGFGIVSIEPQMGNLKNSSIVMPTIKGQIIASYQKKGPRLTEYTIELPGNMAGEFRVNYSSEDEIKINGKTENPLFGNFRLNPGTNTILIKVNSF